MKKTLLMLLVMCISSMAIGQTLFINEFMASNDYAYADENGQFDDWFEIYNAGTTAIDIGGMYVSDGLGTPDLWQIPATAPELTTIPAGGFLRLWADDESDQGVLHLGFKLSGGGEDIVLTAADGSTIIDSYTYGPQITDVSLGRMPDGSENWQSFGEHPVMGYTCSPGRSNITLRINEFIAKNDNGIQDEFGNYGDWIELYNFGENDMDITGMYLTDALDNPTQYTFNPTIIPAGEFLLIWSDGSTSDPITDPDTIHTNFKLSAGGESVGLYLDANTVIDTINFGAQTPDISYGRYPDGTDEWISFSVPSPGASNTYTAGPIISSVTRNPMFPEYTDAVIINAGVESNDSGLLVTLKYSVGADFIDIQLFDDGLHEDGAAGDNMYGGTIPAHAQGTNVDWYIQATDDAPSQTNFPTDAPNMVLAYIVTDWTPTEVIELTIDEPSGLAYNHNTGTLFTHNDGTVSDIYEISTSGALISTIAVQGTDFEGIAFNAGYDTIYVVEEAAWTIKKYTLDGTLVGEILVDHSPGQVDGLEGITIDHLTGHIFVLHEKNNPELIELTSAGLEISRIPLTFSSDVSGITIHPVWQTLFILSDEGYSLNEVSRTGNLLRSWYIPLDQAEGVTFGADEHTIYMAADRGNKLYEFAFNFDIYTPPPVLFVNEFMAKNTVTITDENGDYDDWIEIYNPGTEAIDIGGYFITDDLANPTQWLIPSTYPDSTTIQPGEFLLLWADKEPAQGVLHVNIKLGTSGEQIGLYFTDGVGVIDTLTFGAQAEDISAGRLDDGGDLWGFFTGTTPGASNSGGVVGVDDDIASLPSEHYLSQNYPNPFNPTTMISYTLSEPGYTELTIHNVLGQTVATLVQGHHPSGVHNVVWNGIGNEGQPVATGIYFYRMQVGDFSQTRKMMFIK